MKKLKVFDAAGYLNNERVRAEYLNAALEEGILMYYSMRSQMSQRRGMFHLSKTVVSASASKILDSLVPDQLL